MCRLLSRRWAELLPGDYAQTADVRHLDTYAIVNGVLRSVLSLDLDREMANDLPEQVAGGAGLAGGSGTIVWALQYGPVQEHEVSPWHTAGGWPPQSGDKVQVYATDGVTSWPRFTGRIDRTTGSVHGGMRSTIVDRRDDLNAPFTREALLRYDVPLADDTPYRMHRLDFWYILTQALRRARFFNTPPAGDRAAVSVTFQGSTMAHIGSTISSDGATSGTYPLFHQAPWGWCVGLINASYRPSLARSYPMNGNIQVSLMVAPDHSGDAHIRLIYGSDLDNRVRLRVWSDRRVAVYFHNTQVALLSAADMDGATMVALVIKGSSWTLRNDQGRQATGSHSRPGSENMSQVQVQGTADARIAGLIVDEPTAATEFRALDFIPNMSFTPSTLVSWMEMSPRLLNKNVGDEVDRICKATLTASFFDETGVLRMIPSDTLAAQSPVQTITSLDDITELGWEYSLLHYRAVVNVLWYEAFVSRTRRQRKELYRGSKQTLDSGDEVEVFAVPDNDTEWFGANLYPERLDDTSWGGYNRGVGSFTGVYYTDDDNNERPTSQYTTTITSEPLGLAGVKITHRAGTLGGTVEANLGVSENSTNVRERLRGDALPVIRGRGEGKWVEQITTSNIRGTELPDGGMASELTHELGPWGAATSAQRVADFLADRVTRIQPTITNLRVTYDPRRQLGDVITIQLGVLDVTLRALIVGIHEDHQPGDYSQALDVRILDATSTRNVTYHELEAAWQGGNYNGLQAVWANLDYEDFEADPLRFAPQPQPPTFVPPSAPKYSDLTGGTYTQLTAEHSTYDELPDDILKGE